jgi:hypothetical protein
MLIILFWYERKNLSCDYSNNMFIILTRRKKIYPERTTGSIFSARKEKIFSDNHIQYSLFLQEGKKTPLKTTCLLF